MWKDLIKKRALLMLALPGIVLLFLFNYLPLAGLVIAFKDVDYAKGILRSDWVGLNNFQFFFTSNDALRVTRNTLGMNALFISATLVVSVVIALMLYEVGRHSVRVYQTVLFMPYLISWVVASYALEVFIDLRYGTINQMITAGGSKAVNFYMEPSYWVVILVVCYLWKNAGYYTILYYTRLLGIDATYYEAADIDGASRMQKIRYITLPILRPMIILLCLIQIGNIFYSDFGMFYFLTKDNGMLYPVTDVIDTYVFRALRRISDPGMGAAVGLYQSVMGFVLVMGSNYIANKIDSEGSVF